MSQGISHVQLSASDSFIQISYEYVLSTKFRPLLSWIVILTLKNVPGFIFDILLMNFIISGGSTFKRECFNFLYFQFSVL